MTETHRNTDRLAELSTLLSAVVLDDASGEELDRLNDLLKADVELRRYASRFLEEESVLRRHFEMLSRVVDFHKPVVPSCVAGSDEQVAGPLRKDHQNIMATAEGRRRRTIGPAVFLAASILLMLGALALWPRNKARIEAAASHKAQTQPMEVGLLVQGQFVDWERESHLPAAKPFRVGDVITAQDGLTNLRFNCGAEVLLKGPAELKVLSPMRAALRRGTLTARVEESAHGFRIDTPNSKLIDLGTEFGLSVDDSGTTDTVVFSGKVALQYPAFRANEAGSSLSPVRAGSGRRLSEGRLLIEGEAMRILQSGEVKRLVSVKRSDYPLPRDAREKKSDWSPIIESVADNLRDGDTTMCYRIVHQGLVEDARAFVDRHYQWNGINAEHGLPNFLRGADYVMPFCDDKLSKQLEVRIGISRPARLYVLIDDRVELPQWLIDEFQDSGYDVGIDESATAASWLSLGVGPGISVDKCFSVWFRDIAQPSNVVLGSMKSPTVLSLMYCVAAIPLEVATSLQSDPIRHHEPRLGSGLIRANLLPAPAVEVLMERVSKFSDLKVAKPSTDDIASHKGGVAFRLESNGGKYLPHKSVRVENGTLPVLNDGELAQNGDDLDRNVWYDGQGRFSVDLLKSRKLSAINTFSWHRFERAPQYFTLWGSNAEQLPDTSFVDAEQANGWELIGYVNTFPLGHGGVHASSLHGRDGSIGRYRHLLWITENTARGTFFTEIDVHAAND